MEEGKKEVVQTKGKGLQKSISAERFSPSDMALLSEIVGHVFDLQHQYGKTQEQIKTLVKGFAWALRGYQMDIIVNAFREYVLTKGDVPSPSDIRLIIDPIKPEWTPDWPFYNSLKALKESGGSYALNSEEAEYLKACEEWSLKRFKNR